MEAIDVFPERKVRPFWEFLFVILSELEKSLD
jgi:hypothetical protein